MRNRGMAARIWLGLVAIVLFAGVGPVRADDAGPRLDVRATAMFDQIMSPYCPAVTLSACTSPNARALRDSIRTWMKEGQSDAEIQARLIETYGQGVMGVPSSKGFGIIGWIMPLVGMIAGAILLGYILRRAVHREQSVEAATAGAPAGAIDDELKKKIEADVRKRLV
ncbi:MAG: cytochrome c-type biogenesis protein CcmH [Bdellovibrionales bacterium]|nr:cytochrome c-type biogenesis protein CcmH [Bdellovibrionales bacterium]